MSIDLSRAEWFKSSRSHSGGECVEAAHLGGGSVAVRDSKNPGPALVFGPSEWDVFLAATQTGRFDRA
ncbi:DUF397 domain-containing protein [Nocardia sp. CDC160]|uniref:DUF397 domain-containing protein n=1 Tax=Nocardia sp. CDC160 TaxID=3112166 RepID=UPI002DBB5225|nr:DUF397 domain-containing protein [Nocardia sp. CDC160]MEC3916484.1 DUF397 domain-containing protein [Nocardia sp. CDC160]